MVRMEVVSYTEPISYPRLILNYYMITQTAVSFLPETWTPSQMLVVTKLNKVRHLPIK